MMWLVAIVGMLAWLTVDRGSRYDGQRPQPLTAGPFAQRQEPVEEWPQVAGACLATVIGQIETRNNAGCQGAIVPNGERVHRGHVMHSIAN